MGIEPGLMVGQNVRLERMLGHGGMGSVWIADHLTLNTKVAVKFISADVSKQPDLLTRFTREATAAAQIKSPHVVQIFDHGITSEGYPYIVMELLEGEDLGKHIERRGALAPAELASIISQACKALGKAHALGIVHRDIKPDNIFLAEADGELFVKVLDFGIAKRVQGDVMHMTSTGAMVGTPYYMSPEQVLSAKAVDAKSDLWSLGVVAYHALTGSLPFHAETLGALCVAINACTFAKPSAIRPELGTAFDAWFERAMAREPAARFASAKEMADALQRAVSGLGASVITAIQAAPPVAVSGVAPAQTLLEASVTAGARGRSPSIPVLALAAAAIALMGMIGVALGVLVMRTHRPPTGPELGQEPTIVSATEQAPVAPAGPTQTAPPTSTVIAPSPSAAPSASKQSPASVPTLRSLPTRTPTRTAPASSGTTKTPPRTKPDYGF